MSRQPSCHDVRKYVTWLDHCCENKCRLNFCKIWIMSSKTFCKMDPCWPLASPEQCGGMRTLTLGAHFTNDIVIVSYIGSNFRYVDSRSSQLWWLDLYKILLLSDRWKHPGGNGITMMKRFVFVDSVFSWKIVSEIGPSDKDHESAYVIEHSYFCIFPLIKEFCDYTSNKTNANSTFEQNTQMKIR